MHSNSCDYEEYLSSIRTYRILFILCLVQTRRVVTMINQACNVCQIQMLHYVNWLRGVCCCKNVLSREDLSEEWTRCNRNALCVKEAEGLVVEPKCGSNVGNTNPIGYTYRKKIWPRMCCYVAT